MTSDLRTRISVSAAWIWLAAIVGIAVLTCVIRAPSLLANAQLAPERGASAVAALIVFSAPVILAVAGRRRRAWKLAVVVAAIVPGVVMMLASGTASAAALAFVTLIPGCCLGRSGIARWLPTLTRFEAWVVGSALGMGLVAILTFGLGLAGQVRWYATLPIVGALWIAGAWICLPDLRPDDRHLRSWLTADSVPDWTGRCQVGLIVAVGWLSMLWACAPEIMPDAARVRLPTAEYVVASGGITPNPDRWASVRPGVSELIYAFVLTSGPVQATKFASAWAAWLGIAGVAAIALRLGGPRAALIGAVAAATFPVAIWVLHSASADSFAMLYAAATGLVLVQPGPFRLRAIVVFTALLVVGIGIKASFATVLAGFAVVAVPLVLTGLGLNTRRASLVAGLGLVGAIAVLTIAALNLALVGQVMTATGLGGTDWRGLQDQIDYLRRIGGDRSLVALATLPFDMTIRGARYGEGGDGVAGFLLLALVPLTIVFGAIGPARRIAGVVAIAYVAWFWSSQYHRYGLPIFALFGALGSAALVTLEQRSNHRLARIAGGAVVFVLGALSLFGYLSTFLIYPGEIPWRVSLGLESRSAYLDRNIAEYSAMQILNAEPHVALVATPNPGYAQLYARGAFTAALMPMYWGPQSIRHDEQALMDFLDEYGFTHILMNRANLPTLWDTTLGTNEEFLRRNTLLLGGKHNTYVYRILPPASRGQVDAWASGPELLANGGFERATNGAPDGWSPTGAPVFDASGESSRRGRGAVRGDPTSAFYTVSPVRPNTRYLLSHATRSAQGYSRLRLQINWLDANEATVGVSIEVMPSSPLEYNRRSMLATAPPTASTAIVFLQAHDGEVWFDDVSLREFAPPQ